MKMTNKEKIANRIRQARELAGLSQGQVAKMMNMHRPTISEIEAGRRNVKVDELSAFSNLYGVEVSWIAGESTKVNKEMLAAARELSSMSEDDLETLISIIKMVKSKGKGNE